MQFKQVCALLLITACNASVDSNDGPGGGGGGDDTPDTPGGPSAGNGEVQFLKTMVRDERADQIDFTHREPLHAHITTDTAAFLGGTGCADVYQYGYIKSHNEVTANELAFRIEANDAAEYRVRAENDAVELDWTPVAADGSIVLGRDIASGKHYLDVQIGDDVATTCWNHHVLGAPVEVKPAGAVATGLMAMSFAAQSPISQLVQAPSRVPVFEQRFLHHASAPVTVTLDLSAPAGTYARKVVETYVVTGTSIVNIECDVGIDCNELPPDETITTPTSGALATGTWQLQIIDEATSAPATSCTVDGLRATCNLPAATAVPLAYRAVLSAGNIRDLATSPTGTIAEHTIRFLTFTGERGLAETQRCSKSLIKTINEEPRFFCVQVQRYERIRGLDGASLALDPVTFTLAGAPSAQSPAFPLAYVPQAARSAALSWSAGDAALP